MKGMFKHASLLTSAIIMSTTLAGCSDSDSKSSPGDEQSPEFTISGTAKDFYSGEAIDNATVSVAGVVNGETVDLGEVTTGESGQFTLSHNAVPTRLIVSGEGGGYGEYSLIINNSEQDDAINSVDLLLQGALVEAEFDASQDYDIEVGNTAIVSISSNSLVNADGTAPEGNVSSSLTIIDPSSDPSLMPGNYQTINDEGDINLIESFGAISATFKDQNGNDLNLAEGQTATIRIPLADGIDPNTADATIPLFYFDETTGYWIEEGTADLTQLDNNSYVYQGTVSHFTVWNADKIYETINIIGCVVDHEGQRLPNVTVTSQGRDYIGSATSISDDEGIFTLPARQSSEVLISARSNTISNTEEVDTGITDLNITETCLILSPDAVNITLTWGENPSDLDSHLYGPANAENTEQFHIYYARKQQTVGGVPIDLDVDDTNSFGPEVVSIPRFPFPGTYQYYVNLFTGEGSILESPARVLIKTGDQEIIYSPTNTTGGATDNWSVFNIEVDENLTPTIVEVQEYVAALPQDPGAVEDDDDGLAEAQAVGTSKTKNYTPSIIRRLK